MPYGRYWAAHDWLTRQEAAIYTGRSESTIRRAVKNGELEEGGTKGKRSYRRAWLDQWMTRSGLVAVFLVAATLAALGGHARRLPGRRRRRPGRDASPPLSAGATDPPLAPAGINTPAPLLFGIPYSPGYLGMRGRVMGMARKHLDAVRNAAAAVEQARQMLRTAIWEAVESGETYRDIAEKAGISHSRVSELFHQERRRREQGPPAG